MIITYRTNCPMITIYWTNCPMITIGQFRLEKILLPDNFFFLQPSQTMTCHVQSGHIESPNFTFQGVGYATMTIVFWLDIYYCIIISWTLYYLIMTFVHIPELPWRNCGRLSCSQVPNQFFSTQLPLSVLCYSKLFSILA